MKVAILTLFPAMFTGIFDESIIARAIDNGLIEIAFHDLREWGIDERKTVDDHPFGGGPGMVFRVDVIDTAVKDILKGMEGKTAIILTAANGNEYTQQEAYKLASFDNLLIICGHYEGIDERVREHLITHCYSIGKYVLTGGELPAAVIVDSVVRLLPDVLHNPQSLEEESSEEMLEYPQYTKPREYSGWEVPEVLLSGNHEEIKKWRSTKSEKL